MKLPRVFVLSIFFCFNVLMASSEGLAAANEETTSAEKGQFTLAVRRLTESQYRHTIDDIFGAGIEINARFEPEQREAGLLAVGSSKLSITASGFEQHVALATSIATQVLSEEKRATLMRCEPAAAEEFDATCARQFLSTYGELLFRRPLSEAEIESRLAIASAGARQTGDFYVGLQLALSSLLIAPEFLFRIERAEPDPVDSGSLRLDGYSKATRLSFFFWNTAPDRELLEVAGNGGLHTEQGLLAQIRRLSESPRMEAGVQAFLIDMMQIEGFENMVKDPAIYPKFNQLIADSAREQMVRTIMDLLVTRERDYRELFTSRETFINRPLAAVYQVPFASTEAWTAYTFPESSERVGIFSQIGFLALFSHPGTSSPTRRGIKIHEIFLCEPTPDPPADVDFSQVVDSTAGTVRGRLLDHMQNTGCTVCHQRSDPPGLALEHFDGLGQLRTMENGSLIDDSAELFGRTLQGAQGVAQFLYEDSRVPACLVRNLYAYGVARRPDAGEQTYFRSQVETFAENGYRVPGLFEQIAASPEFFKVVLPEGLKVRATALTDGVMAGPDQQ
ncbi:MAG: DUF1592 domain-containing protein [Pseudomonadales bacterium]|nr:DUF1592 domain-containing protein [Pseudomonadales bacterium]